MARTRNKFVKSEMDTYEGLKGGESNGLHQF